MCIYKKESNPNKKVKLLAICHLLKNGKTITEVSKILFKAYNTIKNWWQAFKKDGIRGLETKKIPGRPPKIKMQSVEDVLEWQHDMKKWFSRLKKDGIDVWCNDTTTLRHDIARRFGLWAPEGQRVFGTYHGNHTSRFINGAVSLSGKRFFTATNTLVTPVVIDFFTDLLKWRGKIAAIYTNHT